MMTRRDMLKTAAVASLATVLPPDVPATRQRKLPLVAETKAGPFLPTQWEDVRLDQWLFDPAWPRDPARIVQIRGGKNRLSGGRIVSYDQRDEESDWRDPRREPGVVDNFRLVDHWSGSLEDGLAWDDWSKRTCPLVVDWLRVTLVADPLESGRPLWSQQSSRIVWDWSGLQKPFRDCMGQFFDERPEWASVTPDQMMADGMVAGIFLSERPSPHRDRGKWSDGEIVGAIPVGQIGECMMHLCLKDPNWGRRQV